MATQTGRAAFVGAMVGLASAAFGVIAALAWNAAITELFNQVLGKTSGLVGLFIYAIIVTVIAVIVMVWLGRLAERLGLEKPKGLG
ncbi:MAG: DUF5654 family protein [Chloroflexi bacterium]|nr:DUF5654 family protein [Chloroflexota bacterium]